MPVAGGFTWPVATAPCYRTRRWRIAEARQRLQQIADALAGGRRQAGATPDVQAARHRSEQLWRLRRSEERRRLPVPYTCVQKSQQLAQLTRSLFLQAEGCMACNNSPPAESSFMPTMR